MARSGDIIAAVATPLGRGGVGIVRLSGVDLAPIVRAIIGRIPEVRRASKAAFLDSSGLPLDEGVVLYFRAPHSYTGEDVLELQGHGGPVVMRMVLSRCTELGARLADPGEFTRRAFENNRLDLAQAEAVADLIDASTEQAAKSALRSLRGQFSALIQEFESSLVELRMLVEAGLDFPEEEIDGVDRADLSGRLVRLQEAVGRVLSQSRRGSLLRTGVQVVLAGQPNVGKSSLLNRVAGEDVAIVTSVAGTTRDPIRESLNLEGVPLNIIDTAGLRDASDEVEVLGIQRSWRAIDQADLVLFLVDATQGLTEADGAIIAKLPAGLRRIVVFNKIDLCSELPRIELASGETRIYLSAKTGEGIDLLRSALLQAAGWQSGDEDVFIARERHIGALELVERILVQARGQLRSPELMAEELRLAHKALGSIVGEFTPDDLLGEIFSRFCIGK